MFVCVAVVGLPWLIVTVAPGLFPLAQIVDAAGVLYSLARPSAHSLYKVVMERCPIGVLTLLQ